MLGELTNNAFLRKVLLVILITLLPLIPAYILFKFLPSEPFVNGPFKGLQVNFSGATAIYFILRGSCHLRETLVINACSCSDHSLKCPA